MHRQEKQPIVSPKRKVTACSFGNVDANQGDKYLIREINGMIDKLKLSPNSEGFRRKTYRNNQYHHHRSPFIRPKKNRFKAHKRFSNSNPSRTEKSKFHQSNNHDYQQQNIWMKVREETNSCLSSPKHSSSDNVNIFGQKKHYENDISPKSVMAFAANHHNGAYYNGSQYDVPHSSPSVKRTVKKSLPFYLADKTGSPTTSVPDRSCFPNTASNRVNELKMESRQMLTSLMKEGSAFNNWRNHPLHHRQQTYFQTNSGITSPTYYQGNFTPAIRAHEKMSSGIMVEMSTCTPSNKSSINVPVMDGVVVSANEMFSPMLVSGTGTCSPLGGASKFNDETPPPVRMKRQKHSSLR